MITNVDAVTVFNGRTDKATRRKIYIPTVIRGVSYVEGKGSKVADNGVWSDDVQYKRGIWLSGVNMPVTIPCWVRMKYLHTQRNRGLT